MKFFKPVEILEKTDELLSSPERWNKGRYYDKRKNCWCLKGALYRRDSSSFFSTNPNYLDVNSASLFVRKAILELFPQRNFPGACVIGFNDHPDTTFEDVKAVLKRAKELASEDVA